MTTDDRRFRHVPNSSPAEICITNPVCETKLVHTGLNCLINVRYRAIFGWILDKM